ncbi:hypothetical protein [Streptomyces laurentii]
MTSAKPSATNSCRRTSKRTRAKLIRLVELHVLTEAETGSFIRKQ